MLYLSSNQVDKVIISGTIRGSYMTDSEKVIKLSKNVIEIRTYIKDQIIRLSNKSNSDEIKQAKISAY